jgi:glutamine amidotransferase
MTQSPPPIHIIDYELGNVGSVANMLRYLRVPAVVIKSPEQVARNAALILPGVGAFDHGVENLARAGWTQPLKELVAQGSTLLGICLGMQLLARGSEEGSLPGLSLVPAHTRRFVFDASQKLKIPHMGWNETRCVDRDLFGSLCDGPSRFYFVHSYHVVCDSDEHVAATCHYGATFTAAVRNGRVFGTQFHPEKSHTFGMTVLRNYARFVGHTVDA